MAKACSSCGGPIVGRHAAAKACSDACRQRTYRARAAEKAGKPAPRKPAPEVHKPTMLSAPVLDDERPSDSVPEAMASARISAATRAKLAPLNRDDDPLAVYLLSLANLLDNPTEMAGGALSSIGKEYRATYREFFDEHGQPEGDEVDKARDEVASKRQQLAERKAKT